MSEQNLQGSTDASKQYGYSGYSLLDSYDPVECARRCDAVVGCYAFDVFFERDASIQPTDQCPNPSSEVVIKCTYWGSPVSSDTAVNVGQYQDDFHVLIAGSNGYVNKTIGSPPGYSAPVALGKAAILAPKDCNNADTYMGVKIFTKGPFDTNLCAAACDATSAYNVRHPPKSAPPQICQFFNTYILYNETTPVGQYCAMYNETWPATYAKNTGQ
nr:hypothetical protein CFP56_31765 [Quercus suber]